MDVNSIEERVGTLRASLQVICQMCFTGAHPVAVAVRRRCFVHAAKKMAQEIAEARRLFDNLENQIQEIVIASEEIAAYYYLSRGENCNGFRDMFQVGAAPSGVRFWELTFEQDAKPEDAWDGGESLVARLEAMGRCKED